MAHSGRTPVSQAALPEGTKEARPIGKLSKKHWPDCMVELMAKAVFVSWMILR